MGESGILLLIFLLLLGAILAVSIVLIRKAERERDEALQHVADARTDFLSRISNDIKTPMNVIMGMTAVGLEESDHPEKMVECLGKIDTASRFLMGLLNDLVDVSMIELGRFRLHPKPYALEDFMEAIRDMTEPECAKKGITFHMSGGENSLNVMVDPIRLEQLFFNLAGERGQVHSGRGRDLFSGMQLCGSQRYFFCGLCCRGHRNRHEQGVSGTAV